MMGYNLFNLGASAGNNNQADAVSIMRQLYAGLIKTDFWCRLVSVATCPKSVCGMVVEERR